LLLGVWGLGSLLGGLAAAQAAPPADRVRRLCVFLALLTAGHALLALPAGLLGLAVLLLLAGAAIAPAFGIANTLVDSVAPAGAVTEAFTWLATRIARGLALGSAIGGALADRAPGGAFVLAGLACGAAALYAYWGRGSLRTAAGEGSEGAERVGGTRGVAAETSS
jgi:predicted MFS family arabinose efflux permease